MKQRIHLYERWRDGVWAETRIGVGLGLCWVFGWGRAGARLEWCEEIRMETKRWNDNGHMGLYGILHR